MFYSLLFTALPGDFDFFKLTQPLTVSVRRKKENLIENYIPYGLRNPYRYLKYENSHDYAQKPKQKFVWS
jgi:hypothetical protein